MDMPLLSQMPLSLSLSLSRSSHPCYVAACVCSHRVRRCMHTGELSRNGHEHAHVHQYVRCCVRMIFIAQRYILRFFINWLLPRLAVESKAMWEGAGKGAKRWRQGARKGDGVDRREAGDPERHSDGNGTQRTF